MMRILIVALLAVLVAALSASGTALSEEPPGPLDGLVIALDAGHGGTEPGATYPANSGAGAEILEKDVNLAVVYELRERLVAAGAGVVLTRKADETISSRKQRVNIAIGECKSQYGKKCDALVSVHHNGSTDPTHDGLLVIYNEKQDVPLATAIHDALLRELSQPPADEGYLHGGYGMTVYGRLVSVITEAYYITNDWEAEQYRAGTATDICDADGDNCTEVLLGDRTADEADALYQGLLDYFGSPGDGGSDKCPPGKQKRGAC